MLDTIKAADTAFFAAMQACDAEAMAPMMAPDCVYLHSFGTRDTKDSYLDKVRTGGLVYHRVEVTQDTVLVRGDVATVVGTMSGTVTAGGVDRRLMNIRSSVWARGDDGAWQLVLFQPTPWLDR